MTLERERWRDLSDYTNSKGEPLVPVEPGPLDDLWELMTPKAQQAVARGEVTLEELVDRLTEPDDELCCGCYSRVVTRPRFGLCDVCLRRRFREIHEEKLAALEAERASAAVKKSVQRLRDELNPDRPRGHKPYRLCSDCGERLPALAVDPAPVCSSCRDLRERRHPEPS